MAESSSESEESISISTDSSLSDTQEKVIAILPVVAAFFSVVGSAVIVRLTRGWQSSYERILFGLSVSDIASSTVNALAPYLVPAETSHRIYAFGNEASCTALGTLWQITTSGFMYSGMLSLYYLLTIRMGVTETIFAKKVELMVHVTALGGPILSGFLGLGLGLYGEVRLGPGVCGI